MLLTGIYCIAHIDNVWLMTDKYCSVHDDKDRYVLFIFSLFNVLTCQNYWAQSLVWVLILSLGIYITLAKLYDFPMSHLLSLLNGSKYICLRRLLWEFSEMIHVIYLAQSIARGKCSINVSCYYCLKVNVRKAYDGFYTFTYDLSLPTYFFAYFVKYASKFLNSKFTIFNKFKPGCWEIDYIV